MEMEKELRLEIIKGTSQAALYVRIMALATLVAAVVTGISLWNAVQTSWVESRIQLCENQLLWHPHFQTGQLPPDVKHGSAAHEEFNRAKDAWHLRKCSPESVRSKLEGLQDAKLNNILLVSIPFFDVKIDVNDLSLFSGLGFSVLLYLLLYATEFRRNVLLEAETAIFEGTALSAYERMFARNLIGTHQVISLGRQLGLKGNTTAVGSFRKRLANTPHFLYVLPVILQFAILAHDMNTWFLGQMVNPFDTIAVMFLGILFFALCIQLTRLLFAFDRDTEEILQRITNAV